MFISFLDVTLQMLVGNQLVSIISQPDLCTKSSGGSEATLMFPLPHKSLFLCVGASETQGMIGFSTIETL